MQYIDCNLKMLDIQLVIAVGPLHEANVCNTGFH